MLKGFLVYDVVLLYSTTYLDIFIIIDKHVWGVKMLKIKLLKYIYHKIKMVEKLSSPFRLKLVFILLLKVCHNSFRIPIFVGIWVMVHI